MIHDSFKKLFIELKTEHTIQRWCTTSDAEEADVPNGCVDSEDGTEVSVTLSKVRFDILYGKGISKKGEIIDIGVEAGIIEKSGTWYSYEGERMGQGRENVKTFLEENPDISAAIEIAVRESAGLKIDQALIKDKAITKPKKEDSASSEGDVALSQ